jgi:hypothetical protein
MAGVEIIEPRGCYVDCPMPSDPIDLVFWQGQDIKRLRLSGKQAIELSIALNDAVLRSNFAMRSE